MICDHCHMLTPNTLPDSPLLVACLCADWCGTCREYQPQFAQLQARFPGAHFVWIDVEDESELVDPIAVDNFPTLLIASPQQVLFFGTVTPHLETLQRLIRTHIEAVAQGLPPSAERDALAQRLWQRKLQAI